MLFRDFRAVGQSQVLLQRTIMLRQRQGLGTNRGRNLLVPRHLFPRTRIQIRERLSRLVTQSKKKEIIKNKGKKRKEKKKEFISICFILFYIYFTLIETIFKSGHAHSKQLFTGHLQDACAKTSGIVVIKIVISVPGVEI